MIFVDGWKKRGEYPALLLVVEVGASVGVLRRRLLAGDVVEDAPMEKLSSGLSSSLPCSLKEMNFLFFSVSVGSAAAELE